jgi:hypothetical protein
LHSNLLRMKQKAILYANRVMIALSLVIVTALIPLLIPLSIISIQFAPANLFNQLRNWHNKAVSDYLFQDKLKPLVSNPVKQRKTKGNETRKFRVKKSSAI